MQALELGGQFNAEKLLGFLTYLRSMGITTLYDACNSGMGGGGIMSEAALRDLILELEQGAINLYIHPMGDRSTHTILNAIEAADAGLDGTRQIGITLCHLGLVQDDDFERFAEVDVVASFTLQWHGGWIDGAHYALGEECFNKMFRV